MIPLTTQEQFEELLCGYDVNGHPGPQRFLVWYTASWCVPCQKMDKVALEEAAKEMALPFYYCDQSVNPDTIEYANLLSFPTFVAYKSKNEISRRVSADTTKVCQWIRKIV